MTRYLLDTHVFLWADAKSSELPPRVQQVLRDSQNHFYLSLVSLWEIQIKHQLGKLTLRLPIKSLVDEQRSVSRLGLVPIKPSHIYRLADLPLHHRDPFDRLLIAQALQERLTIITADPAIMAYGVPYLGEN